MMSSGRPAVNQATISTKETLKHLQKHHDAWNHAKKHRYTTKLNYFTAQVRQHGVSLEINENTTDR